ncbi:hypothetical protein DL93DRAFT_2100213 [Clavulina sp. PMI_390]|nr:hypothetical protein DL93DRAFT_2100213 [Clavulina sp. PMI_390]
MTLTPSDSNATLISLPSAHSSGSRPSSPAWTLDGRCSPTSPLAPTNATNFSAGAATTTTISGSLTMPRSDTTLHTTLKKTLRARTGSVPTPVASVLSALATVTGASILALPVRALSVSPCGKAVDRGQPLSEGYARWRSCSRSALVAPEPPSFSYQRSVSSSSCTRSSSSSRSTSPSSSATSSKESKTSSFFYDTESRTSPLSARFPDFPFVFDSCTAPEPDPRAPAVAAEKQRALKESDNLLRPQRQRSQVYRAQRYLGGTASVGSEGNPLPHAELLTTGFFDPEATPKPSRSNRQRSSTMARPSPLVKPVRSMTADVVPATSRPSAAASGTPAHATSKENKNPQDQHRPSESGCLPIPPSITFADVLTAMFISPDASFAPVPGRKPTSLSLFLDAPPGLSLPASTKKFSAAATAKPTTPATTTTRRLKNRQFKSDVPRSRGGSNDRRRNRKANAKVEVEEEEEEVPVRMRTLGGDPAREARRDGKMHLDLQEYWSRLRI